MILATQELSRKHTEVLLHFGADGAATCELVIDYMKCLTAPLGNVIVMDSSTCLMHACNRICSDHITHSNLNLGGVFSLTKLMYMGTYFGNFAQAIIQEDAHTNRTVT